MTPLLLASRKTFDTWRTKYGFEIVGDDGNSRSMYSSVSLVRSSLRIDFSWDGLEGELAVTLQAAGGRAVNLEDVVHLADGAGLSLRRIRRGATSGMLETRLRKIASLLEADAKELLELGEEGPLQD